MPWSPTYKALIQGEKSIHKYFDANDDFIWANMKKKFDRFLISNGYKIIDLTQYRHNPRYRQIVDNIYIASLRFIFDESKIIYYDDEIQAYSLFNNGDSEQYTIHWLWVQEPFENCLLALNPPNHCIECQNDHTVYACSECQCRICQKCFEAFQDPWKYFMSYRHSWQCRACKNRNMFHSNKE